MLYYKMVRIKPVESVMWVPEPAPITYRDLGLSATEVLESQLPGWTCIECSDNPGERDDAVLQDGED